MFQQRIRKVLHALHAFGAIEAVEDILLLFYLDENHPRKMRLLQQLLESPLAGDRNRLDQLAEDVGETIGLDVSQNLRHLTPTAVEHIISIWKTPLGTGNVFFLSTAALVDWVFDVIARERAYAGNTVTPVELIQLMIAPKRSDEVPHSLFDPSCGSGGLLLAAANLHTPTLSKVVGRSDALDDHRLASLARLVLGTQGVLLRDYSHGGQPEPEEKFDMIVSNPPFGQKTTWTHFEAKTSPRSRRMEVAYLQQVLHQMSATGQAAIIVPMSVLTGMRGEEREVREQMISKNLLEAVVLLPKRIFYGTGVQTAILYLNKVRETENILFIDLSKDGVKTKARTVLPDDLIEWSVLTMTAFLQVPDESRLTDHRLSVVSPDELEAVEYSFHQLLAKKVVASTQIERRSSSELYAESNEVVGRLQAIQVRIAQAIGES